MIVGLGAHRAHTPPEATRLSERAVARIVQGAARAAGLDGPFAGHSLRRGQITAAVKAGVPLDRIQAHARHRDLGTTLACVEARTARDNHPELVIGGTDPERIETDQRPGTLGTKDT